MHARVAWIICPFLLASVIGMATTSSSSAPENASELSLIPVRGMISVTPQGNPASYADEISRLVDAGVNVVNTFHGTPSNNAIFLDLADEAGLGCIPSIQLICWIRFGDPPYPSSGALGWPNLLEWLKLYGYQWPEVPEPFSQGQDGTDPLTDEQLEEQVREILQGFGNASAHPSLLAFYAFDEPSANAPGVIDRIARVHGAFCKLGFARGDGGPPPTITGIFLWGDEGQAAAREFMAKATGYGDPPAPCPAVLMYDCYVMAHAVGSDLSDYESYANRWVGIGDEFGVPVIAVPQGFQVYQRPAPNELRVQAYLALAAGCKGISWFRLETIQAMEGDRLAEVADVNRDLETIGPILIKLDKVESAATMLGCGGRYKAGTANTFQHTEERVKYLFIASKDVTGPGLASLTLDEVKVGYPVERILDCHADGEVPFVRQGNLLNFSFPLEPGQGRLFKLVGDPTNQVPDVVAGSPLLLLLLSLASRRLVSRKLVADLKCSATGAPMQCNMPKKVKSSRVLDVCFHPKGCFHD